MNPKTVRAAYGVALLAITVYSIMNTIVKGLSIEIGAFNTLFWRSLIAAPLSAIPWWINKPVMPERETMRLHIERGVLSTVMMLCFFWGIARVPIAQAMALSFIAPIIALFLAAILLKEKVTKGAMVGSALGFAGVLVIMLGQAQAQSGVDVQLGALAILASACCYAYNIILMRRQAQVAGAFEVAFFQNLTVMICLLAVAPFFASALVIAALPRLAVAAALGSLALSLLGWAYARAQASILAPLEYTAFLWAMLLGYLVFDEHVKLMTGIGAVFIIIGCLVSTRSHQAGLKRESAA